MPPPDHGEHELSAASQAYLLTARSMTASGQAVTVSAIAARMQVSKQAASEMVARLSREGLVEPGSDRDLRMTGEGRDAADAIFRRHALLEWLLTRVIGLGWAESDEEAMRLQGAVSPRVESAIRDLVGDPKTCPHGNPIDLATALERPAGVALSDAEPGSEITIYRITEEAEEDADLLSYLEQQRLVPGIVARVVEVSHSRDSIVLDGPTGRASMGLRPASLIRVLPGRADSSLFHQMPDRSAPRPE
ncbi:MAG TPA: metal-dependent transcriptional regulator [Candidatus Limnocylindrales bacterium]|nr:metal-dependent transcriptional regulator [Candidatus Limnocylindrales bacterium]